MRPLALSINQLIKRATQSKEPVSVSAWVKSVRSQKRNAFLTLNDGSTAQNIQVIARPDQINGVSNGCCIQVKGLLSPSPRQDQQACDLHADSIDILGLCDESNPIQKKEHGHVFLRRYPHLRPKTDHIAAMLRIRDVCSRTVSEHFRDLDFYRVEPPLMTTSDCEGGSAAFRVQSTLQQGLKDGDKPTFLTVSSQLYLESLAASLGRVFCFAPAFRAERSLTSRHLSEFWMLEAEASFVTELDQVLTMVEGSIRSMYQAVSLLPALQTLRDDESRDLLANEMQKPFARVTYTEAVNILREADADIQWGDDLDTSQERWLAEQHFAQPVFVTHYPARIKPFYMKADKDCAPQRQTVACFDLLVPRIGELAGGSLREDRKQHLEEALDRHKLSKADYEWYLDLRRYGSAPHGGFGLGYERLISYFTGLENVRECIAFPRAADGFTI